MTEARTIRFIGDSTVALHGNSIIVGSMNSGERMVYDIVQLRGGDQLFEVAVPAGKALDGAWLMERLIAGYKGRAHEVL